MSSRASITITLAATIAVASRGSAQRLDSAQCRALLSAPVHDSVVVTIGLTTHAFDTTKAFSAEYRAEFAAAIRQVFRVPSPLPVRVYTEYAREKGSGRGSTTVVPTVSGAYAAELSPDGHLDKLRIVGGARVTAFDEAFLGALRQLSDAGLLPTPSDGGRAPIELRLGVGPTEVPTLGGSARGNTVAPKPLFRIRVPALGEGKSVAPSPGNSAPRYPDAARRAEVEGKVLLRFVVNDDGRGDASSIQVEEATKLDFASAVLAAFPAFRFAPLELHGCPLASIVEMPFEFQLTR